MSSASPDERRGRKNTSFQTRKRGSEDSRSPFSLLFFLLFLAFCCTPWVSPPIALALGLLLALTIGAPFREQSRRWTKILLQASIVGLGFGMNLESVVQAGKSGVVMTLGTLAGTLGLGILLGRLLKVDRTITWLISCGTAICGGSAIAAVGPVTHADGRQMSIALGTVFILNAIALFLFPPIGQALQLSQAEFGMWGAIAIHDTSSVVGAAARYGNEALATATTVKLTRALWIIPLVLATARFQYRGRKGGEEKEKKGQGTIPWFIPLFAVAVVVRTLIGDGYGILSGIALIAKQGMVITLFLIGAGLSRAVLKGVGVRPFLLGALLWVIVSAATLVLVIRIL